MAALRPGPHRADPRRHGDVFALAANGASQQTLDAVLGKFPPPLLKAFREEWGPRRRTGRLAGRRRVRPPEARGTDSGRGLCHSTLMNDARAASGGGVSFYLGGDVIDMAETPKAARRRASG